MLYLVNVAPDGEAPRIINVANMLECSMWASPSGTPGTLIRMMCEDGRKEAFGPYKITVSTPFAEIIRRIRHECLKVT